MVSAVATKKLTQTALRVALSGLFLASTAFSAEATTPEALQQSLREIVPLFGHRNWIVIADSAYPDQAREGIQTIVVNADQLDVLRRVLATLSHSRHVRPNIFTDQELQFVPESDAPGISQYRRNLAGLLGTDSMQSEPHEKIIARLDEAAKTFRVLIVKTNMTIPYTSVFLQLDCAYWSADAERRLREAMVATPSQ